MNLLNEGLEQGIVVPTEISRKLTVDGITKAFPVYKIRLDALYFNDQNDRIATWISQYRADHDGALPDMAEDVAKYNDIIESFIIKSNPDSIHKTEKNIELFDQQQPGVVLADGRIIDGNRRFTCLRRLAGGHDRFRHFEAVILNQKIEYNAKEIKILELSIQHGEESRVEYNTIDRLVGIYQDVVENHMLTVEEYAKGTNESEGDIRKRLQHAQLMIEFLEFINAPGQYHIARDMQIYSILEEIQKLTRKCRTEDEAEDLKLTMFANVLMKPSSDMTRYIRNVKNIVSSDFLDDFLEEQKELATQVIELLPPVGQMNEQVIRDRVRTHDEIIDSLERSVDKAVFKAKRVESRNRPLQLVEKATSMLEDIDVNLFAKLNDNDIARLSAQMEKLHAVYRTVHAALDEER